MKKENKNPFIKHVVIGCGLLITVFILSGVVSLIEINTLGKFISKIYRHPLEVSNVSLQTSRDIVKMHRSMKDVVLSGDLAYVQHEINQVTEIEKQVYEQYDRIQAKIFCSEGQELAKTAKQLFVDWKPIREEVIALVKKGERDKAALITQGKGADHLFLLEQRMSDLTSYARNYADEFVDQAATVQKRVSSLDHLFVALGTLISLAIAFFTIKETNRSFASRSKVEKALRESELRFRRLVENVPDSIFMFDTHGKFIDANEQACKTLGYTLDELQNLSVADIDTKFSQEDVIHVTTEILPNDKTTTVQGIHQRKDGSTFPVEVHVNMLGIDGQSLYFALVHDITARKKAELALRKSQEEWEKTFNAINDIVSLQDTSMKIVKVNQTGCDTLDLPCEDIIGRHCYELFHGSNEPCPECPLLATQKTFEPYTEEMTHEKLGKTFLVSAAPVLDDQGKMTHITHVAKDITEKKKIEEQLFLNEKLSTIAGLAAGVAHEINTPLSAILQSQQIIEMRLDPDKPRNQERAAKCGVDLTKVDTYLKDNEIDSFMKGMRASAITAGNIIKNLLEFSRPHKGEIRNANLSKLFDTSLELARADYDLKKQYDIINVEIVKEYDADLTEVPCVAMEFEQVILNLIKNAVHAMTDNKTENQCITVRTVKTEKMARIEVEDNGPGIDEVTQLQIFDPFFTTKEVGMGTGLGLSVSHALIVDKHRGNIWVESEPGKGAKFIIELPLIQEV